MNGGREGYLTRGSGVAEDGGLLVLGPLFEGLEERQVEEGVNAVGTTDRDFAVADFKDNRVAGTETESLADLARERDLTLGRKPAPDFTIVL
jgi:hypothetical protein